MVGIKRFKIVLGIFIPFLAFFLMSQNTLATSFNSWLNIQDISKTNLSNDWITHNTPNAGSYSVSGASSLQTYRLSASANLPTQATGAYFSASGDIYLDVPSYLEGGVICNAINDVKIVPEYVSYNTTNSSLTSCSVSNPNIYMRRYTLHIETSGSIPSQADFTSFFWSIGNTSNQTIISLVGTPNDSPRVFLSGNINISIGNSPELEGIGVVNQNLTIISNDLKDVQQQMSQNTDAIINNQNQNTEDIINNQNENTEAIIKSNQNCHMSNNLFDFVNANPTSVNGGTGSNNNGIYTVTARGSIWAGLRVTPQLQGNTTYTFSALVKNTTATSGSALFITRLSTENGQQILSNRVNSGERAVVTFTTPSGLTSADIRFLPYESNATAVYSDIMLEEGSSFTSYEPYGEEICKNFNEEYYDEQRQADQNISNQTPSDIDGAENQATTNLIGVLSGFISAFSNINATNCNLTLEFPDYAGGSRVVNICSGKEKAPRIVEIGSSLLLIGVFVPLAYILIRMIYNEIRSWTNG